MNAQDFFKADTDCLLDRDYLYRGNIDSKGKNAPRSLNPWPFFAAVALAILFHLLNTERVYREQNLSTTAPLPNSIRSFSKVFGFGHNSKGVRVPKNKEDKT